MTSHIKVLQKNLFPLYREQSLKISGKSEQNYFFTFTSMRVDSTDNSASLCFLHIAFNV